MTVVLHAVRDCLKKRWGLLVCALLCVVLIGFIFGNSLKDGQESAQSSDVVVDTVKPIVDPEDQIERVEFSFYVRKLAHFTEFFWLGMALCGVAEELSRRRADCRALLSHYPVCGALLTALLVAVVDEWIQSYTGRTSSVRDVLIDFSGAICGFFLTALVVWGIRARGARTRSQ